jgi:hypothetical protein
MRMTKVVLAAATALWLGFLGAPARASDCTGLARMSIESTNLLSAAEVPAGNGLPAYCRVLGYVRPAINFEIRLPLADWNGKFYMAGCGGFCGSVKADAPGFTNAMNYGLRRHYAVSTMDSGHWGKSVVDGRWAYDNLVAEMDWAQRAVTATARVTKAVIAAFYGHPQRRSYFAGCSTGGRMAAMEAERYPDDFDGIISGAPALDYTGLVATFFAWVTQADTAPNGTRIFPTAKVKLLADAVAKSCDDALGLIDDPRQCKFDLARLQCKETDAPDCLTPAETAVVKKWYAGPVDSQGVQLYPGGLPLGSEANWPLWLTGAGKLPPLLPLFGQDFDRYMAFIPPAGPRFSITDFNFDRDPGRMGLTAAMYNAATFEPAAQRTVPATDLAAFARHGGKMILYHGWGDPLVTPFLTVQYYETLAHDAGGMARLRDTARLFMIPGMDHCGINTKGPGIGDEGIDPLTALENWVEHGEPPAALLATKASPTGGAPLWTRPICAFPEHAELLDAGNPRLAGSYRCAP